MHRLVTTIAKLTALLGGAVLLGVVAVTCISITGRWLATIGHSEILEPFPSLANLFQSFGPIRGDFELVEAGVAFAIMAFLPWCQLTRAHASVGVVTAAMPERVERVLALLWEIVFAIVLTIVAWRLFAGMGDKARYAETTFMLQMPVWWAYAAVFVASMVAVAVALFAVWMRVADLRAPPSRMVGASDPDIVHPPASGG